MNRLPKAVVSAFIIFCFCLSGAFAQKRPKTKEISVPKDYRTLQFRDSAELQSMLHAAVGDVLRDHAAKGFKSEEIAATLFDLRDPNNIARANVAGDRRVYPASVVKMFYLAAISRQIDEGKVTLTPELTRGLRDMIVDSANEATQYILDVITDTSSGAELPQKEFDIWQYKRNRANRYFSAMGYQNINVDQKTFCEDAYGIEQQSRKYSGENRNKLTTNATARLLAEIVLGRMASPERTAKMLELMKRDPFAATKDEDDQAHGFIGRALINKKMTDVRIWSKAGWTSTTRHDAAYVETADGLKFVLVIFTENHANDKVAIPDIAAKVIDGLREMKK
jgi:beta-lactamase class A